MVMVMQQVILYQHILKHEKPCVGNIWQGYLYRAFIQQLSTLFHYILFISKLSCSFRRRNLKSNVTFTFLNHIHNLSVLCHTHTEGVSIS